MQNERERLIELLEEAKIKALETIGSLNNGFGEWYADHLLANGVIVPPCKVGDTVYFIYETCDEEGINGCVLDCKVEQLGIDSKSAWYQLKLPLGVKLSGYFRNNTLGKTVFLTKEEAERELKALKEREDK